MSALPAFRGQPCGRLGPICTMSRTLGALSALAVGVFLVGCAGPAPHYQPSIANVEALKKAEIPPVRTGNFTVAGDLKTASAIQLRANSMVSGVGNHYGDYIAAALRQELELARLYDPQAGIEIAGTLLENDINAGGMTTNDGLIAVQFVVRRGGQQRYGKTQRVQHQWEGAFAGAVAIPNAANNYPIMVQKLIAQLLADPEFIQALRP